ncbi:Proliferating cell nuclear antigen [Hordeum vulgare]|nr:Proliferating cell nuclear antigen [Hordeum vulgare]
MGMNLSNMAKMLCCASNDGIITIKADDCSDTVTFMFESPNQDKSDDFKMKLMDIDIKHLDIPDSEYQAIVCIPSFEFSRICKDLSSIGDTDKLMSIIYSNFYSNALVISVSSLARELSSEEMDLLMTVLANPRQFKVSDWFLNRKKDYKDGRFS